jgi:hypothetical protein
MIKINLEGKEVANAVVDLFSPLTEMAGTIGDKIRVYRKLSVMRALKRAKAKAETEGLTLEPPPLKFLIPYLEKVSLEAETDDVLNELWANLLVSSATKYKSEHNLFIRILNELSTKEARAFQYLARNIEPDSSLDYKCLEEVESNWADPFVYIAIRDLLSEYQNQDMHKIDYSEFYKRLKAREQSPGSLIYFFSVFSGIKDKYPYDQIYVANRTEFDDLFEYLPFSLLKSYGLIGQFNSPEYWFGDLMYVLRTYFLTPLGANFYKSCVK